MPSPSEHPRVGVTLSRQSSERTRLNYLEALERAGADPVALLSDDPDSPVNIQKLDALVLSGGGDVNPARYGQVPHPATSSVDDQRDAFEIEAIKRAVADGNPILAICRGQQILNVALGGSLEQHIESNSHRTPGGLDPKAHSAWHEVELAADCWLAGVYGSLVITTNSRHHQAIRDGMLAGDLRAVGWSRDGYVEACEGTKSGSWIIGVQWHPERVEQDARGGFNQQSAALMSAFVSQVRELSAGKHSPAMAEARK